MAYESVVSMDLVVVRRCRVTHFRLIMPAKKMKMAKVTQRRLRPIPEKELARPSIFPQKLSCHNAMDHERTTAHDKHQAGVGCGVELEVVQQTRQIVEKLKVNKDFDKPAGVLFGWIGLDVDETNVASIKKLISKWTEVRHKIYAEEQRLIQYLE